ncbi:MAG: replication-relaxation family protein [Pyrinomonadaceae bacterium]|nr:replication-relaxation family protein [Pyrinomonadaceae bacterium]
MAAKSNKTTTAQKQETNVTTGTSTETKKRRKRFTRDPEGLPKNLTERQIRTVAAVYEHRTLTSSQIYTLLYAPEQVTAALTRQPSTVAPNTVCSDHLQRLYHHGYLERKEQAFTFTSGQRYPPYVLDKKGVQLLAQYYGTSEKAIAWSPKDNDVSPLFLSHQIADNDIRIAFILAARNLGYTIPTWLTEPTLRKKHMVDTVTITTEAGTKEKVAIVPDDYFTLDTPTLLLHHFVEIDMGTVTITATDWKRRDWERKVRGYMAYINSGKYEARYGTKGLRILTITTTETRLKNLKEITEKAGGTARFWFTTFEKALPATIITEPIWEKAGTDGLYTFTR